MNTLKFSKMHGLGNDFMVIDAINQRVEFTTAKVQRWADRNFGIGFDQLLVVESAQQAGVDFRYRIFNADGSEVQQCGNGARCFAKFVYDKGLTDKTEITVETASGIIVLYVQDNGWIKVNMGVPNFAPESLPFTVPKQQEKYTLEAAGQKVQVGAVSMGNPHAVMQVIDIAAAPVEKLGAALESHSQFPERVNVGFAQVIDNANVKLRVYERGAAETLACGTGACAAMVVLSRWGKVGNDVQISLPGGDLRVQWEGQLDSVVWMTGPAEMVFEGIIADD
ncbi:diaminopimelate epimerase [Thiomicrorhabdus marina]|uniref:diaminopimelate epimerase n=1 Tax=Thiomicrorhabdus marina TaxID=2818442 RepID=UPI003132A896